MNRWIVAAAGCMVWGMSQTAALAQDRIYRCGNEYTNSAAVAKQRNCQVLEGGHVTVLQSGNGKAAAKSGGTDAPAASSSSRAVQVDPGQQKARDNDARAILQDELRRAQDKLNALKAEYNEGHPTKTALELRNPQIFQERVDALKANIARQEADVAGIQRELSRHSGG